MFKMPDLPTPKFTPNPPPSNVKVGDGLPDGLPASQLPPGVSLRPSPAAPPGSAGPAAPGGAGGGNTIIIGDGRWKSPDVAGDSPSPGKSKSNVPTPPVAAVGLAGFLAALFVVGDSKTVDDKRLKCETACALNKDDDACDEGDKACCKERCAKEHPYETGSVPGAIGSGIKDVFRKTSDVLFNSSFSQLVGYFLTMLIIIGFLYGLYYVYTTWERVGRAPLEPEYVVARANRRGR